MAYKRRVFKKRGKRKGFKKRKKLYNPYKGNPSGMKALVCRSVKSPFPSEYYCTFTCEEMGYWSTAALSMPSISAGIPIYPYRPFTTAVGAFNTWRSQTNYVTKSPSTISASGWQQLIFNTGNTIGVYNYFCPLSAELEVEIVPQGSADNINLVVLCQPRLAGTGLSVPALAQDPGAKQLSVNWIERGILRYKVDLAKFHGVSRRAMMSTPPNTGGSYSGNYNTPPASVAIFQVALDTSDSATAFANQVTVRMRLRVFGKCFDIDPSGLPE